VSPLLDLVTVAVGGGAVWLWLTDRDAFSWPPTTGTLEYKNVRLVNPPPPAPPTLVDWQQMEDLQ
jgi:hypothetical protein